MVSDEQKQGRSEVDAICRLRIFVLATGEITQPPWWRTQYLTPTGLRFLERVYPRTAFGAAVHGLENLYEEPPDAPKKNGRRKKKGVGGTPQGEIEV